MINCDYYIQHDIIIEYISHDETIKQLKINLIKKYGYVGFIDEDDDVNEYEMHLKLHMKLNTYQIILYNQEWINKKYNYLLNDYLDGIKLVKCYENVYSYENKNKNKNFYNN